MRYRIAALAVVAVMAMCALVPASAGAEVPQYDIDMRTGDVFTYTPNLTLPATVESAVAQDWAVWTDGTVAVTFPEGTSGDRQLLIRATWARDGLTQTAFQAVNFGVFGHILIDGQTSVVTQKAVITGTKIGTIIYAPSVNEVEGTVTSFQCEMEENEWISWDSERNAIVTVAEMPELRRDIACRITATNTAEDESSNLRPETVTADVTVSIGSELVITGTSLFETYVGCGDGSNVFALTTNYDGETDAMAFAVGGDVPDGLVAIDGDKLVVDPSKAVLGAEERMDYRVNLLAAVVTDGVTRSDTKQVTVTVWKEKACLDAPLIRDVEVSHADGDNRTVALSASIFHATDAVVNWGDGSSAERMDGEAPAYSAGHSYLKEDKFVMSLTARSTHGATVHYVLYDTAEGSSSDYVPPEDGGRQGESVFWMPLAFLAVALAAVYATVCANRLIIGGAVLSAVLSVVSFAGWI